MRECGGKHQNGEAMTSTVTFIECPCCGDDGAESNAEGYYYDGQPLICGCAGHVSCDSENEPDILIGECDCEEATRAD